MYVHVHVHMFLSFCFSHLILHMPYKSFDVLWGEHAHVYIVVDTLKCVRHKPESSRTCIYMYVQIEHVCVGEERERERRESVSVMKLELFLLECSSLVQACVQVRFMACFMLVVADNLKG